MGKTTTLRLFIFFGILTHAIETSSEENIKESSVLHIRVRRLIDKTPNGNRPMTIEQIPYIVNILKNRVQNCAGIILAPEIILTAAHCVEDDAKYTILSGSSYGDQGKQHDIIKILIHPYYHRMAFPDDLALLNISPPIDIDNSPNREIMLYNGLLPLNANVTVSGWGCNHVGPNVMEFPHRLRSITMQIISQGQCRRAYQGHIEVTNKNICTLDICGQKFCGVGDSGAPLVFDNQLIGVFAGSRGLGSGIAPDIFMKLSHPIYKSWIGRELLKNLHNPHS